MHRPPGFQIIATVILALGTASCDGATEPSPSAPPPVAAQLTAATEKLPAGTVGTELLPTPVVRATDAAGRALAGVPVTFEVGGGGQIAVSTATTGADGLASVSRWTLGHIAQAQTVTALTAGVAPVVFTATAAAGPAAQVHASSGGNQFAPPDAPLSRVLEVRVTDAFDNGIAGAPVTFTVTAGGGSIASAPTATDSAGVATSGAWTLGGDPGAQQVRARSGTLSTVFSAFALQPIPGLQGRLAFVSEVSGNSDIYTMNADGTELQQLTADSREDDQPAWAPAGDQLAFVSDRAGQRQIYFMNADGSNITGPIPGGTTSTDPSWSPDANTAQLAYASFGEIASIDTRTGVSSVLAADTANVGYYVQPSLSPDGQRLAFVNEIEEFNFVAFDIYTMNADGTGQASITHGIEFGTNLRPSMHPTWSPDGTLIAFVRGEYLTETAMRFHVAVMAPDGSGARDLAWAGDVGSFADPDPGSLAWSPDGRNIAFTFTDRSSRSVKLVPLAGGEAITLIPYGHSPSWR
jgi:hypothetical protein